MVCHTQGIIQKNQRLVFRQCRALCFLFYFILTWKCQKCSLNRGTLVSTTAIYQTKCPFTVLRALFLFFQTLPYDSRLFPDMSKTMYFVLPPFTTDSFIFYTLNYTSYFCPYQMLYPPIFHFLFTLIFSKIYFWCYMYLKAVKYS